MNSKNFLGRIVKFILVMGSTLVLIYGVLPMLTSSVGILNRMSVYLADNGINPTNYYYTDVEQVAEAEQYLRTALEE
ncbi:hypothetical protein [uncultured Desulfobacter sp.]|uniref:hypothetical protein n=1 Tax=uncultured Desulfobacter sp. TaxID=240139 RepID=UPI002AAA7E9C|nr:hypothetical protein [uncultured Desulfobacter sp.]